VDKIWHYTYKITQQLTTKYFKPNSFRPIVHQPPEAAHLRSSPTANCAARCTKAPVRGRFRTLLPTRSRPEPDPWMPIPSRAFPAPMAAHPDMFGRRRNGPHFDDRRRHGRNDAFDIMAFHPKPSALAPDPVARNPGEPGAGKGRNDLDDRSGHGAFNDDGLGTRDADAGPKSNEAASAGTIRFDVVRMNDSPCFRIVRWIRSCLPCRT
jgi:hypothetical protein